MAYRLEISANAASQFRKLTKVVQRQLAPHIDALAETPRPPGVKKLSDDTYRIRVGEYRILYDITDQTLTVLVLTVGHRREVYRRRR
jgi:mRNA interferase RelE/StbE